MKCQENLLKREESQEKVRKFYQLSEFCGDQLWSDINVKFHLSSLKCKHAIWNVNMQSVIRKCQSKQQIWKFYCGIKVNLHRLKL